MDRKHRWKRKYILLCITGLILLPHVSCTSLKEDTKKGRCPQPSAQEFLHSLRNAGDFENALKRSRDTLSASPRTPPGDEALFDMGLVYAHPQNPKRDYRKSADYFRRLLKEFPHSTRIEETKIWVGVLEDIEKAMRVDFEMERRKKELSK